MARALLFASIILSGCGKPPPTPAGPPAKPQPVAIEPAYMLITPFAGNIGTGTGILRVSLTADGKMLAVSGYCAKEYSNLGSRHEERDRPV